MNKINKRKLDFLKVRKNFLKKLSISCISTQNNVAIILYITIIKYYMYSNHKQLKNQ